MKLNNNKDTYEVWKIMAYQSGVYRIRYIVQPYV